MQPRNSQFLLWEQQKANLTKPANRWRWHPEIIKWCVSLHAKSPSAYNLIRQSGSINNLLKDFEARLSGNIDAKTLTLASHVLVLMVRSVFDSFKAPVAYFATKDLSGDDLYPIVWECVLYLELLDLHVRAIVGDGASPNQKFFKLHQASSNDGLTYFTCNPFSDGDRIYFFCDVPHLLKTTRNNWENSGSNQQSRHLRVSIYFSHLHD